MTMLEFLGQMPFPQFDRLGIGALLQYRQDGEKAFRIARSDRLETFRISDVEPQRFGVEKAFEIGGKGLLVHQQSFIAFLAQHLIESIVLLDRKRVVLGKSVSVRVDLGGGGILKKKK